MGNIFSFFYDSKTVKYNDSLLDPLNEEDSIQYASLLDIESINGQVGILEKTTQSSLKNISTDVKYLFEEVELLKSKIDDLCNSLEKYNNLPKNENENDITNLSNIINKELHDQNIKESLNNEEMSIYLDASNNNDETSSHEETY